MLSMYKKIATIEHLLLPKDIVNQIKDYVFIQQDESYYRMQHIKNIQNYINYLIINSDFYEYNDYIDYNELERMIMQHFEIEPQSNIHYYYFGYSVDRYDYTNKDKRNGGYSRWYNKHVRIECWFCETCGNYMKTILCQDYHPKITCSCQ